jgi:MFS family permease
MIAGFPQKDSFAALRLPEFRNYISGRLLLTIASLIQAVIVGWQVYELTKDPFSLGLIGLAEAIPAILISLFAGHIVDTRNRKTVLLLSYGLLLFCAIFLFIISSDIIYFVLHKKLFLIYSVIFISGIARGFTMPAAFAFMSQLVPKNLFPNAVTWNATIWQLGAITGPAVAGFIYGFFGFTISYLIVAFLIAAGLILISVIKKKPIPQVVANQSLSERLTAGIRFVFSDKIILSAISLDLFAVLFGGATALLPIYSAEILFTGPQGLGMLRAAPSIGAVLIAIFLTKRPPLQDTGKKLLSCVFGFGICMIVFAISRNFYLSLIMLALSGAFDAVSVVIRQTIIQIMTPDNMKGRVSAVNSIFIGSSNEIGAFESGLAAKLMGVVPSVVFGGIMTLVVVFIVLFMSPKLRKLSLQS